MKDFYGIIHLFPLYIVVLIRTTALIGMVPFFQHTAIPMQVKVSLSALIALIILPSLPAESYADFVYPDTMMGWTFLVIKEATVGILLGLVAGMIAAIVLAAGEFASRDMGLSIAAEFNPETQMPETPLSILFTVMFSLLILVTNTHLWFIEMLVQTYEIVPINGLSMDASISLKLVQLMSWIYTIGVKLAAPVMAILFIVAVAIGVMSLAAPQVNILLISFPIRMAIGFTVLGLTTYMMGSQMQSLLAKMRTEMEIMLRLMA